MQTSLGIGLCTTLYRTICEPIVVVRKFEHDRVTFGVFDFRRQYTHRCGTVAPMLGVPQTEASNAFLCQDAVCLFSVPQKGLC